MTSCSFNKTKKSTVKDKISKDDMQVINTNEHIKNITTKTVIDTLCSKEFEGRLVGSKGNDKTRDYIEKIFAELKLDTLIDDNYCHKYYERVANFSQNDEKNELKLFNNVIGVIKGKNTHNAVVISAHFDHIGYENGQLIPGALDNASGVASLIQIAKNLKEISTTKTFDMDIIFCAFNSEEIGRRGSQSFVNDIQGMYYNIYNINIDCIGGKQAGNLTLNNKSKISDKLYDAMKSCMQKNKIQFSDIRIKGEVSDYKSFEEGSIPNINIVQENIKKFIHKPTDTPDTIDYKQIEQISNAICDFIQSNNGKNF